MIFKQHYEKEKIINIPLNYMEIKKLEDLVQFFGLEDIYGGKSYVWRWILREIMNHPIDLNYLELAFDNTEKRFVTSSLHCKGNEEASVKKLQDELDKKLASEANAPVKLVTKAHALRYGLHFMHQKMKEKDKKAGNV